LSDTQNPTILKWPLIKIVTNIIFIANNVGEDLSNDLVNWIIIAFTRQIIIRVEGVIYKWGGGGLSMDRAIFAPMLIISLQE